MASALPQYSPYGPSSAVTAASQPAHPTTIAMTSFHHVNPGARPASFSSPPLPPQPSHVYHAQSFRSFQEPSVEPPRNALQSKPQIYTAVYSSVAVYEMEVNRVAVMRRRSDSWLNATQILKVAGIDKGRRTKIIEKEILTGQHEKVQGGYGRYQGTWINYHRGREFCRQYGVEDMLRPLLDYDLSSDGTGMPGKNDTPTKEQAMAANRKRFYNAGNERSPNGAAGSGTLFSNIGPVASSALAAMHKAARYDSPAPRPSSAQKRPPSFLRRTSSQQLNSQDSNALPGSQQSFVSDNAMDVDSTYNSQNAISEPRTDGLEPPRKKFRPSFSNQFDGQSFDAAMQEETPTEPNESFLYNQEPPLGALGPSSLPPLTASTERASDTKRALLLDLFADSSNRANIAAHEALTSLSGADLDVPLDNSANTALHWAATLARLPLVRALLNRGANLFRGNAVGQTPLMSAVAVNNSWDNSCFPEMLELFGPLIEIRDASGRTVLHHIAVSSAIKGRASSARYYLESLLVYIVRQGGGKDGAPPSASSSNAASKPLTLGRFMADVINVQDKSGNTALNLVARMGNRAIVDQLDELGADFNLANNTGFTPKDFGVYPKGHTQRENATSGVDAQNRVQAPSPIDQMKEEMTATLSTILAQATQSYTVSIHKAQELLDSQQKTLRDLATQHNDEAARFEGLSKRARERAEVTQKIGNLKQAVKEAKSRGISASTGQQQDAGIPPTVEVDKLPEAAVDEAERLPAEQREYVSGLASADKLRAQIRAYEASNAAMQTHIGNLKARSIENEGRYRKIVSLCTGVEEDKIDGMLDGLVAAVESEAGDNVTRVREFLKRVEGGGAAG